MPPPPPSTAKPPSTSFALAGAGLLWMAMEILWSRLLTLSVGAGIYANLATTAGFFLGFALGALLPGRGPPGRRAALALAGAGLFTLALAGGLDLVWGALPHLAGPAARMGAAALILLPGAMLAGLGIPALYAVAGAERGYAAVTAGSAAGGWLLLSGLAPFLGLNGSALALAAAAVALAFGLRGSAQRPAAPAVHAIPGSTPAAVGWLALGLSGFASLLFQSTALIVLGQGMGGTVHTFANTLAAFLVFNALGAAWVRRQPRVALSSLAAAVPASILLAMAVLAGLASHPPARVSELTAAGELARAAAALAGPAFAMGALFTRLLGRVPPTRIPTAAAVNALGAALAPAAGYLLLASTGRYATGLAVSLAGYALLAAVAPGESRRRRGGAAAFALATALAALAPWPLSLKVTEPGWKVTDRRDTVLGTVLVRESEAGPAAPPLRVLQVDLFSMGGRFSFAEARMGHLALLLHPSPQRALFLGMGTGVTAGAALAHGITRLDVVELVPEVIALADRFSAYNANLAADPRAALHAEDARTFVRSGDEPYDLVVADLFHPGRDGAANLFTLEHFQAIRRRVAPGGVFVQWLPLHQIDAESLDLLTATFLKAFAGPGRRDAWLGLYNAAQPCLALSWSDRDALPEPGVVEARLAVSPAIRASIPSALDLGASWLGTPVSPTTAGPFNRDRDPLLLFRAPAALRRGESDLGSANLAHLLQSYPPSTAPWASPPPLLRSYRTALALYLQAEVASVRTPRVGADRFEEYFAAYRACPDFTPTIGRLAALADRSPPAVARERYTRLLAVRPGQPSLLAHHLRWLRRNGDPVEIREALRAARAAGLALPGAP